MREFLTIVAVILAVCYISFVILTWSGPLVVGEPDDTPDLLLQNPLVIW